MRYTGITVNVDMANNFEKKDRIRLERAADTCPIKHSFKRGISIKVHLSAGS